MFGPGYLCSFPLSAAAGTVSYWPGFPCPVQSQIWVNDTVAASEHVELLVDSRQCAPLDNKLEDQSDSTSCLNHVHPSIFCSSPALRVLELVPGVLGWRWCHTLDKSPERLTTICTHTLTLTPRDNLKVPVNLKCMYVQYGRRQEGKKIDDQTDRDSRNRPHDPVLLKRFYNKTYIQIKWLHMNNAELLLYRVTFQTPWQLKSKNGKVRSFQT